MTAVHEHARVSTPDDLPTLLVLAGALRDELAPERGGALWLVGDADGDPAAAFTHALARPADHLLLSGCLDDVVVGYALVVLRSLQDGSWVAAVRELFVEPAARGVGVGEALMDEVVAWASARGCRGVDAMALPGMRESKNFFERFGLVARAIAVHRPLGQEGR